jgi:chromosomal replication initiator protein
MLPQQVLRWDKLLASVRADCPELYRSWFEDLMPGRLEAGQLEVRVPQASQVPYLRSQCTEPFTQAAIKLTGRLLSVHFVPPSGGRQPAAATEPTRALSETPLSPDYSFEQFVVGPSNRLAHAACQAVCQHPGTLYNPLFIHGRSGLGKTHLLQAVCTELLQPDLPLSVIYISCETFINGFVRAIGSGRLEQFRNVARRAHVLAIDDLQFLADHESSQEEVFHTFNALYQTGRQLVLSADAPPSQIPTLRDRLVSRFSWGLVTQIDPPDRETRHAILQKKAQLRGYQAPDELLDFIAERVESNIRMLEGALTKLICETQSNHQPPTLETARQVLKDFENPPARPLQITDILHVVSQHFGIQLPELLSRKRSRSVAFPRQVGMYLARKLTTLSLDEIGGHFGGRDHSTVLHAERVITLRQQRDKPTAEIVRRLMRELQTQP